MTGEQVLNAVNSYLRGDGIKKDFQHLVPAVANEIQKSCRLNPVIITFPDGRQFEFKNVRYTPKETTADAVAYCLIIEV